MLSDPTLPDSVAAARQPAIDSSPATPTGEADHAAPSKRPNYHPEEGAPDHSEWWSLGKAVLIGVVVVALLGWLLMR